MNDFTQEQAFALVAALRTEGVNARVDTCEYVTPENTVGKHFRVVAVIRDDAHGNTVVRTLSAPADAAKVAKEMRKEVRARAKETISRVRAERAADRS